MASASSPTHPPPSRSMASGDGSTPAVGRQRRARDVSLRAHSSCRSRRASSDCQRRGDRVTAALAPTSCAMIAAKLACRVVAPRMAVGDGGRGRSRVSNAASIAREPEADRRHRASRRRSPCCRCAARRRAHRGRRAARTGRCCPGARAACSSRSPKSQPSSAPLEAIGSPPRPAWAASAGRRDARRVRRMADRLRRRRDVGRGAAPRR